MAIIGIDLGTTNSIVSVFKDGKSQLIPNQFNEVLTPSVVSIENGEIIVGKIAKERLITHHQNTVAAFKTFMGSDKVYSIDGKKYTPTDLSSMIIKQLVEDAKKYLQEDIEEAIISVPAYFNDAKRLATKQAGALAGVKVERIVNEPSAAALASRIDSEEFETLLIFDLGGGTLDVSIVDCFDNVVEIVAVSGDNHLGGEDFNKVIEDYMIKEYHLNFVTSKDKKILLRNIEEMKKQLSELDEVTREVTINKQTIELYLSRDILLKISDKLLFKIKNVIKHALNDAEMTVKDIDRIIMVGGSSRLKVVQEYLEYLFHKYPEVNDQVDYLVGLGCGYVAGIKSRDGDIKEKVLTDICPFSLGVNTFNHHGSKDIFSVIIERNATLPCSQKQYYTTIQDYQPLIVFSIYQGEEIIAEHNQLLGRLEIKVPPNIAGQECVEVCFTYDINGILDVDIKAVSTEEKVHKIFTSQNCVLSDKQLEERIKELEKLKNKNIEDEELTYLYEKAYRIFEESIGQRREMVQQILYKLDDAKKSGKVGQMKKIKVIVENMLDNIDTQSPFDFEDNELLN